VSLAEQLRNTRDAAKVRLVALDIERETLEFVVASIEDALTVMRDGSSIEPSLETIEESRKEPIEQVGPGERAIAGRDPESATATAPPGKPAFDPLGPIVNRCSVCGKQTPTAAGLVTHQSRVHHLKPAPRTAASRLADRKKPAHNGDSRPFSAPIGKAAIPPAPVIRHGKETYLCTRCPRTFDTAEALKGHMQKGHPPVGASPTRPFGEQPVMEHTAGGGLP
jgi:hypothetical protein